jgi:hypothetical protein
MDDFSSQITPDAQRLLSARHQTRMLHYAALCRSAAAAWFG